MQCNGSVQDTGLWSVVYRIVYRFLEVVMYKKTLTLNFQVFN